MELIFWAATDVGKKREINEDNFLVDKKLSLFVVADGMGGHAAGEVASPLAVHEFRERRRGRPRAASSATPRATPRSAAQDILHCSRTPSRRRAGRLPARAQAEPEKRGMGTTASALLIAGRPRRSSPTSATAGSTCCAPARWSSSPRTTR